MVSNDATPTKPDTQKKDPKPVSRTVYKKVPQSALTKKQPSKPAEELKSEIIANNEEFNATAGPMTNQPSSLTQQLIAEREHQ